MPRFAVRAAQTNEIRDVLGRGALLRHPGFSPQMCRVGLLDDKIICHALTLRRTLRYGNQRLRVIAIGEVFTQPAYRGQGYATQLLQDTLTYVVEQGAHLALLRDTTGFFDRFGFSPVWPEYYMTFSADQASRLPVRMQLHAPQREHIPAMMALYDRHWSGRVSYIRTPEQWAWRLLSEADQQIIVALNREGDVCGYITGTDLLGDAVEIVVDSAAAAAAFLAEAGRLHVANGSEWVRWLVPPDDALVTFAREWIDVAQSAQYHTASGWVGRVIDMPALITSLLPEVTAQASTTLTNFKATALRIIPHSDRVEIILSGRHGVACTVGQRDFVQLVFGSLTPQALALRTAITPEAVQVLAALFPPRVAVLGHWDWF